MFNNFNASWQFSIYILNNWLCFCVSSYESSKLILIKALVNKSMKWKLKLGRFFNNMSLDTFITPDSMDAGESGLREFLFSVRCPFLLAGHRKTLVDGYEEERERERNLCCQVGGSKESQSGRCWSSTEFPWRRGGFLLAAHQL